MYVYVCVYLISRDAVTAIVYLHSKKYMHCDIKSLNFLVTENRTVKLADMGLTRKVNAGSHRVFVRLD